MGYLRALLFGVTGIVLVTAVASGPLVPGVSITSARETTYGEGNATVESVTLPETVTLEAGSFGQQGHYLTVPPSTVQFSELSGSPILTYRLQIGELNYTRSTVHFLQSPTERYEATMESDNVDLGERPCDSYIGVLSVHVEDDAGRRTVATQNVTIEVRA
ncbi:hypothetical protein [Haloarcula nitratireducens]|uniref:Uncharacterized protein n=1 Tax=Haloarcula nitratireducens TaxID=2487749 RepID=A0AAW4P7J1_9EURY|nr:hypothetical protein [Halomicroarcula nitratireducens]MBX0293849.1 hypothetical protein [Halomicroarcula nitratireducens]